MSRIKAFLRILAEPSAFEKDAYGWSTNQISKAMLVGFGAATLFSLVAYKCSGEWIDQRITFAVVVAVYAFGWEATVQGWRKMDSFMDTVFFAYGAAAFLVIDMSYVIERISLWYLGLFALLAPGILTRLRDRDE